MLCGLAVNTEYPGEVKHVFCTSDYMLWNITATLLQQHYTFFLSVELFLGQWGFWKVVIRPSYRYPIHFICLCIFVPNSDSWAVSLAVNDNVIYQYVHVFLTTSGSCVAAGHTNCTDGRVVDCYCDLACYSPVNRDCCADIAQTCQPRKCPKPWAALLI